MEKYVRPQYLLYAAGLILAANAYLVLRHDAWLWYFLIPFFAFFNILSGTLLPRTARMRHKILHHGVLCLLVFAQALLPSIVYHAVIVILRGFFTELWWSLLFATLTLATVFWNGIICVYFASYQLGIRHRLLGILCGLVPILNLVMLRRIIVTVMEEVEFELHKERVNAARVHERLCDTKYPILLVHGVFFRDWKHLNYWGRIPKELQYHGARIYYGEHQSAGSVARSAEELLARVKTLVDETGCEKVNIIAHSKGGLDCRYALSELGMEPYVASLTTVNSPHRGCLFADRLLQLAPPEMQEQIAAAYNRAARKLGDESPDFLAAVMDLTAEACEARNKQLKYPEGIFCQSFGSRLNDGKSARFPLNLSYRFVRYFDGANDGLVGESSFAFGVRYHLITVQGARGVSHGDVIDLSRENIAEFDVREFYVQLVHDLKEKGF